MSGLDIVSAEATLYMSNRVDTRSCQRRKFWHEKTSIFETSRNGFAKMVDVRKHRLTFSMQCCYFAHRQP